MAIGLHGREKTTPTLNAWLPYMIVVWVALGLCSYRHVLGDLIRQWHSDSSYSHGPVVIPIAIWLLWQRRSTLPRIDKPWGWGIGLLLTSSSLLWLGDHFHVPAMQRWTIPLFISGVVGLSFGRRVLAWGLPGILFLAFMIPLPFRVETLANESLQFASAWCSCYMLSLANTFAVTDGYTLRMASGQLGITKDCSGLRMTVAIAALGYVITILTAKRSGHDQSDKHSAAGLAVKLGLMMLLVIPAAIVANAARITAMAWVMDHYQTAGFTTMVHDMADWLVLPFSAALLLALRAWIHQVQTIWGNAVRPRSSSPDGSHVGNPLKLGWRRALGVAAAPALLATVVAVSIGLHYRQRIQVVNQAITDARIHERNADWDQATECYRRLIDLQPSRTEMRYRHAWVSLQAAESVEERMQAFFQFEAILNQSPFHREALRTHLEMALEQGDAYSAIHSAESLYSIDRHDSGSLRLCLEAMLRFPRDSTGHPAIKVDRFSNLVNRFGPISQWRDHLVIAVASYCCNHPEAIDRSVTGVVEPALANASAQIGTATACFEAWRFEHVFGNGQSSIEAARLKIDATCPAEVAYRIYLASAREALLNRRPDDAKGFLQHAIRSAPSNHAAYEQLADVLAGQGEWPQSAAVYLRAWRLAGDRPIGLGIKLAETLARTGRHGELKTLVTQLTKKTSTSFYAIDRELQIRLMIVQAQMDVHSENHSEALNRLRHCRSIIAMRTQSTDSASRWLPAVETLQAQCLVRMERFGDAARLFEHRASNSPQPADQWTAAARAWRSDGNLPAAEHCYRNAVAEVGYDSDLWLEYVGLLKVRHGTRDAIEEIGLRQSLDGETPSISDSLLAQAWELVDHPDLAIRHYRRAARQTDQDVAALAIALARYGRSEEAIACLSDPRWPAGASLRAHTAAVVGVHAGNLSDASKAMLEAIMQRASKETSNDTTLLLAMVTWYSHCNDTTAAKQLLEHAVAAQPGNVIAGNNLAMLLADEGNDFDRALACIDKVLEITGPVTEFLDTKGWILVQMDRSSEAISLLKEAHNHADSAAPNVQFHLATAYLAAGDRDLAKESFELAKDGGIRTEQLNGGEQRAWTLLQSEFTQPSGLTKQQVLQPGGTT